MHIQCQQKLEFESISRDRRFSLQPEPPEYDRSRKTKSDFAALETALVQLQRSLGLVGKLDR